MRCSSAPEPARNCTLPFPRMPQCRQVAARFLATVIPLFPHQARLTYPWVQLSMGLRHSVSVSAYTPPACRGKEPIQQMKLLSGSKALLPAHTHSTSAGPLQQVAVPTATSAQPVTPHPPGALTECEHQQVSGQVSSQHRQRPERPARGTQCAHMRADHVQWPVTSQLAPTVERPTQTCGKSHALQ